MEGVQEGSEAQGWEVRAPPGRREERSGREPCAACKTREVWRICGEGHFPGSARPLEDPGSTVKHCCPLNRKFLRSLESLMLARCVPYVKEETFLRCRLGQAERAVLAV